MPNTIPLSLQGLRWLQKNQDQVFPKMPVQQTWFGLSADIVQDYWQINIVILKVQTFTHGSPQNVSWVWLKSILTITCDLIYAVKIIKKILNQKTAFGGLCLKGISHLHQKLYFMILIGC